MAKVLNFGSDPEMFLVDSEGFIVPPLVVEKMGIKRIGTLVPHDPDYHPVYFKKGGFSLIGDGAAFEFNTKVAHSPEELQKYYNYGKGILGEIATQTGLKIAAVPAARFELGRFGDYFDDPENDKQLWYSCRFGCDAQYNAYEMNKTPEVDAKDIKWRYAGGHIHSSGFEWDVYEKYIDFIKLMDVVVGTNCLLFSPYKALEQQRQLFYGVPGNYRPQEYPNGDIGVEYRTPSVSWLETFAGIQGVVKGIQLVDKILLEGRERDILDMYNEMAIESILEFNLDLAHEIQNFLGEI